MTANQHGTFSGFKVLSIKQTAPSGTFPGDSVGLLTHQHLVGAALTSALSSLAPSLHSRVGREPRSHLRLITGHRPRAHEPSWFLPSRLPREGHGHSWRAALASPRSARRLVGWVVCQVCVRSWGLRGSSGASRPPGFRTHRLGIPHRLRPQAQEQRTGAGALDAPESVLRAHSL